MPVEPTPSPSGGATTNAGRPASGTVLSALGRYRIAAYVVGWGLLILCVTIVLKYVFGLAWTVKIWGPIHGALYVGYVLLTFDLAYKDRWSLLGILKVIVAGVIPGVSFVAERWVHRSVLARQKI